MKEFSVVCLISLFALLSFYSCGSDSIIEDGDYYVDASFSVTRAEALSSQQVLSEMPFFIDNMQSDFNAYLKEKDVYDTIALVPTHNAIKVLVPTMKEVEEIERDKFLIVSHFPFGQIPSPDYDTKELLNAHKLSVQPSSADYPQSFREVSCIENKLDSIQINPLYVFWPVNKAIPDVYSYEFCYKAFVPESVLESQEVESSNPIYEWIQEGIKHNNRQPADGYLYAYDDTLSENVPLRYAKLLISGSRLNYIETDAFGHFTLPDWVNPSQSSLTLCLDTSPFTIRVGLTSAVKKISLGSCSSLWGNNSTAYIYLPSSFETSIYLAATYYFYGNNSLLNQITRYNTINTHIDIRAINSTNSNNGVFNGLYPPAYIKIYNNTTSPSHLFGTVLHELGHASSYVMTGLTSFYDTQDVVLESFASFFGWYNVLCYYSSVASSHAAVNHICSQGRQGWLPLVNPVDNYTPLFVDLFDNLNQSVYYQQSNLINDLICNMPISAIVSASVGPESFSQVVSILNGYINTYYTQSEYNYLIQKYSIFY